MQGITADKEAYIEEKMKQFKLVDMRNCYEDIIAEAEEESLGYMDFLIRLLSVEDEGKKARRVENLLGRAHFDAASTLGDIDYSFNPSLDKSRIEELGKLHFLDAKENIIIIGPPGVGKSMIATGIGRNACAAGRKVLFVNAKELVDRLYDEMLAGRLQEVLEQLNRTDLLIIDELSYIKMDRERESLFFQIIRQRYEKAPSSSPPTCQWADGMNCLPDSLQQRQSSTGCSTTAMYSV